MKSLQEIKQMSNERFKEYVGNRFFGCKFLKKDNTLREYKGCRVNVKKYTQGGFNNVENNNDKMVTVWPNEQDKNYRTLNLETLQEFTFQKQVVE